MDAWDDWPRIGDAAIDPATLDEVGVDLGALLAELEAETADAVPAAPERGWRQLRTAEPAGVVLAAPADDARQTWWVAEVSSAPHGDGKGRAKVLPEPVPLRASRAERRRGLRLRWPSAAYEGDIERVVIDVVNDGDQPWRPEGVATQAWPRPETFHAAGMLRLPGDPPAGDASLIIVGGLAAALPLDPGEYARIRVTIDEGTWSDLEPGPHELHVALLGLGVRADAPLTVMVTEAEIERRRSRLGDRHRVSRVRSPEDVMAERLEMLRALMAARERLHAVVDVVLAAASDDAARVAVQQLLGCTSTAADAVIQQSLRRFSAAGAELISLELSELEQPDESEPHAASD
ncbi:hypothetical protein J2X63_001413 [Agromyces sp. 3263]|uniref:hypothetical protein n=1 Tax=Agromyces sp. 3263 TaxID=2817750 RepID=UPI00286710B4|nr:hypothetical protein [Agromyces sp. 3263]MDR6905727.1 hypothetical protein [Agromyces sp. 3263]